MEASFRSTLPNEYGKYFQGSLPSTHGHESFGKLAGEVELDVYTCLTINHSMCYICMLGMGP